MAWYDDIFGGSDWGQVDPNLTYAEPEQTGWLDFSNDQSYGDFSDNEADFLSGLSDSEIDALLAMPDDQFNTYMGAVQQSWQPGTDTTHGGAIYNTPYYTGAPASSSATKPSTFSLGGLGSALGGMFKTGDEWDMSKLGLGGLAALGGLGALTDKPQTATSTVKSDLPSWYTDAAQGALASAKALPDYQSFFNGPGSAAAPLSSGEQRAMELLKAGPQAYGGALSAPMPGVFNEATDAARRMSGGYQGNLTQGLDPRFASSLSTAQRAAQGYQGNLGLSEDGRISSAVDTARDALTGYKGNLTQGLDPRFDAAVNTARGALTGYTGPLTQAADANTRGAASLAAGNVGAYRPALAGAEQAARAGGGSILERDLGRYMNPYWQSALSPQDAKIRQDQKLAEQDLNARLAKVGAFGGSRTAVAQALNTQEGNRRVDDLYARGAKEAFDAATGLASGDRTAQQYLSGQLGDLATIGSNLAGADISRLSSTGKDLYDIDLSNLLRPYEEFKRQKAALPGVAQTELTAAQAGQETALGNLLRPYQEFSRQKAAIPGVAQMQMQAGQLGQERELGNITRPYQEFSRQQSMLPGAAQMEFNVAQAGQENALGNLMRPYQEFTRQQSMLPGQVSALSGLGSQMYDINQAGLDKQYGEFKRQQDWNQWALPQMSALGATERGIADTDLTRRWQDYQTQYQSPFLRQSALNSTLGGFRLPTSASTTQTGSSPSALQSLFGMGSTLWGMTNPNGI